MNDQKIIIDNCCKVGNAQLSCEKRSYLVSAIISVYNCEKFIEGCLDDLEQQTIADQLEIITVNSGSQQNEKAIIQKYQIKYGNIVYIETKERETIYKAWNRGIKAASGKYITNANSDDRHRKDALDVMSRKLEETEEIDFVYANQIVTMNENETFDNFTSAGNINYQQIMNTSDLLEHGGLGHQPMWRKSVHEEFGYFDETLEVAGDYEFWLRVSGKCNFYYIDQLLGLYLLRQDSAERRDWEVFKRESIRVMSNFLNAVTDPISFRKVKRSLSLNCADLGNYYLKISNIAFARPYFYQGIKIYPAIFDNYKLLFVSYLPQSIQIFLRNISRKLLD
jgi:glycosyltransferase involved in cell wall biosynthesis